MQLIDARLAVATLLATLACSTNSPAPGAMADGTSTASGQSGESLATTIGPTADPSMTTDTTIGTIGGGTTSATAGTTANSSGATSEALASTTDVLATSDGPGTTTGLAALCDPAAEDTECSECLKSNCCDELLACAVDGDETMGCACFGLCALENTGQAEAFLCASGCGVNFNLGTPTGDLAACTQAQCGVCLQT